MNNIPPQLKKLAESAELYDQSEKIGNKFNLMIDQIGELDAEIRGVLLGIFKPSDFTNHITERLEIKKDLAQQITEEVNKEIFETIKKTLRADQESQTETSTIYSLEQAGGFSIEKEKIDPKKTRPDGAWKMPEEGEIELPEEILRHIEEHKLPTKSANTTLTPISTTTPKPAPLVTPVLTPQKVTNPPTSNPIPISSPVKSSWEKDNEQHIEPLVDHLLTKSTSIPLEKSSQQVAEMPKKSVPIPNNIPTGPDMYHEPIV